MVSVLKLSCFDLSVVHLALSGSVVESSACFLQQDEFEKNFNHIHAWKSDM